MFKDIVKKALKYALYFTLWVFILSFNFRGRTLFDRAHEVLVENALVDYLDQQVVDTWDRVLLTASQTYQKLWQNEVTEVKKEG